MGSQLLDVSHISLTHLGGLGVGIHVIILLSKRQTTLTNGEDIVLGVLFVGSDIEAEQAIHTLCLHAGPNLIKPLSGHLGTGTVAVTGQESRHVVETMLLQGGRVHGRVVEVGYLLLDATLLVLQSSHAVDERAKLLVVVLLQDVETAEAAVLIRQRVALLPSTSGIHVEISAWLIGAVKVGQVDARLFTCTTIGLARCQNSSECHRVQHQLCLHSVVLWPSPHSPVTGRLPCKGFRHGGEGKGLLFII